MIDFSQDDMQAAFDKVADPADWRAPINATVDAKDVDVVSAAISHFTATVPTFDYVGPISDQWRVTSIGYRAGPAGP